jgi:hypothetical protein
MGKASPSADIKLLRRRSRALGISIRTKRASKTQPEPSYDLIDSASGQVLYSRLSLADAAKRLGSIAEDRAHKGPAPEHERCSVCGTPRLATFRWCKSCGSDFEGFKAAEPAREPTEPLMDEALRFCEWCGQDQNLVPGGGPLIRTSRGEFLCSGCAEGLAATDGSTTAGVPISPLAPAIEEARMEHARHERGRRRLRRWSLLSAGTLGLVAFVIATQLPTGGEPAKGEGGVLGATATARTHGDPIDQATASVPPAALGDSAASPSVAPSPSLTPAMPAAGEAIVQVDKGRVVTWTGLYEESRIQVIVPVHNGGTDWVVLPRSASRYRVMDGRGRELASGLFTVALPGSIGPNQTAYLVETVSAVFIGGSGTPTVEAAVVAAPVARPPASLKVTDLRARIGPDGGLRLTGVVHNDGPTATGWLIAGGVLIDASGRPISAVYDPGRVGPLPAGASATFDTAYPGAPPPPDQDFTLLGIAFEAFDEARD